MTSKPFVVWGVVAGCAAAGYAVSGCAVAEESYETAALIDEACVGAECPGNSDLYAALGVFELSLNPEDVSARGFSIDTDNDQLAVWHDRIDGAQLVTVRLADFRVNGAWPQGLRGNELLKGFDMKGTRIRVKHKLGVKFELKLVTMMPTSFYAALPRQVPQYFPAYEIEYRLIPDQPVPGRGETWHDLCPYKDVDDDSGLAATWAVLWRGDRIDPETGMITASNVQVGNGLIDGVGDWFNISCAGEATIKMLRTGTGGAVDARTTPPQRQATLDMFTARYCPDSFERYTSLGKMIVWDDKTGSSETPAIYRPEAIWNGNGAVCLGTPRVPLRRGVDFGEAYDCVPPPCDDAMLENWESLGWLRSGTYALATPPRPPIEILPPSSP